MKSFRCVLYPEISCTLVALPQLGRSKFGSVWVFPPPLASFDGCCSWSQIARLLQEQSAKLLLSHKLHKSLHFRYSPVCKRDTATYFLKMQLASTSHKQCKQLQIRRSSKCNDYTPSVHHLEALASHFLVHYPQECLAYFLLAYQQQHASLDLLFWGANGVWVVESLTLGHMTLLTPMEVHTASHESPSEPNFLLVLRHPKLFPIPPSPQVEGYASGADPFHH